MNETIMQFWEFAQSKPVEAWVAIWAGALYVWYKSGAKSFLGRAIEAGISSLLSLAVTPDLTRMTGYSPVLIHLAVSSFGFLVLDVTTSILSDKEDIKALFTKLISIRFGK